MKKHFADFYDLIADQTAAKQRAKIVLTFIKKYHPKAKKILELGTGNGNVLASFPKKYMLFGLDIEPRFVALTKKKVPDAKVWQASMHNFSSNETFDVIFSLFDSMNYLHSFSQWQQTFVRVAHHLTEQGIFLFDCYTPGMLKTLKNDSLVLRPTSFGYFGIKGNTQKNILTWDMHVFEKKHHNEYHLHHFFVKERIYPSAKIEDALRKHFFLLEKIDPDTFAQPTGTSTRLLYITKRK